MLPTGNTFNNANKNELVVITSAKICAVITNQYKVGDKILVNRKKKSKHELEFMGTFLITKINDNGTV